MEFTTKNAEETKNLGEKLAGDLTANHKPLIVALTGDLGSGKTTLVQGFAKGLGIKQNIISPTFILMRRYGQNVYHLDLYRLESGVEDEVRNLGTDDIWKDPKNIVIIEWAEKIKKIIPPEAVWIGFENLDEGSRKITINE